MEGVANGSVFVGEIFQLEEGERDAVHKDDDIGSAIGAIFDDGELIDGGPIIVLRPIEIEEFDDVVNHAALFPVFDVDAVGDEFVKGAITFFEVGTGNAGEFADRVGDGFRGNFEIDSGEGFFEAAKQHNLGVFGPFSEEFAGGDVRAMDNGVAERGENLEGGFFDGGFGEGLGQVRPRVTRVARQLFRRL